MWLQEFAAAECRVWELANKTGPMEPLLRARSLRRTLWLMRAKLLFLGRIHFELV